MILIATIASIIAAVFVARGKSFIANCIWSVTNIFIIWHNHVIGEYEMVILFVAYEVIALYGVYNLGAKRYVIEYMMKKRMNKLIREYNEGHDDE